MLEGFGYRNYLVEPGRLSPVGVGDFQPSTFVDYLALKRLPRGLRAWRLDRPLGPAQVAARVAAACRSPAAAERLYLARALATADAAIRSSRKLAAAVRALGDDPDERVREAARAVPLGTPRRRWPRPWRV